MFIILKGADKVTKNSGYVTRDITVAYCIIHQKINYLKTAIITDEHFAPFYNCREIHANDTIVHKLLCKSLPSLVIIEVE